ncbi:MAG: universal stress protein [Planctomycetota bacterium]|jgi:nucleotide-binding universal stress UspA family protein
MIDRIKVALDGSELAREAFECAALIAEAAPQIQLEILHVTERVAVAAGGADLIDDGFMEISEAIRSCKTYGRWAGLDVAACVVDGDLLEHLAKASRPSTLIVVGLKGRFARVGIGSTTRWLIQHATGPVMVVTGPSHRQLGRVAAAYDGSDASARALALAQDLAKQTAWPLTVMATHGPRAQLDEALKAAQELAPDAQLIAPGPLDGDEAQQIEAFAAHAMHALLVAGAHPDSWIHQALMGGVTDHPLRHLRAPIMLVR